MTTRTFYHVGIALMIGLLAGQSSFAQMPPGKIPGVDAAMTKLFGDNNAFTATATARILDEKQNETMIMPMNYALLDGKIRSEVDMTQLKSKDMPPQAVAGIKQMGMDRMVSIVRPDKKTVLVIYPSLRAYAETPMSQADAANVNQEYKIETTKVGTETVDGHPCQKSKVTISAKDSSQHDATVWNATDLNNFPIKIQMPQTNGSMVMTYSNIKFQKPDAKLFDPPTGFDKYDSVEKMMQSAMMKMLAK